MTDEDRQYSVPPVSSSGSPDRTSSAFLQTLARRPITALLVWFFTVGQVVAFIPVAVSPADDPLPMQPFVVASTWVGLLLPAIVITWARGGRQAVAALLLPATRIRLAWQWYVLPLAVVPAVSLVMTVIVSGTPSSRTTASFVAAYVAGFLLQALVHLLITNLWEELVWTGFVQDELQVRAGPSVAALMTAPLFALQHAPLVYGGSILEGLVVMAVLIVLAVPFRMTMGWVLNRTQSIFLVGLTHACGNAMVTGSLAGAALLPRLYEDNPGPMHLLAFAVIGVVVAAATRGRLGHPAEASNPRPDARPVRGG